MSELLSPLEWSTVQRKVQDLIPCDFNPRNISEQEMEKLKESIRKFNLVEIPVIDADNVLIGGHQRIAALFILGRGEELIDVRIPNRKLTEEEFKEYMLRSNINNGEFDWNKIQEFFQDLDLDGIGMDMGAYDEFLNENSVLPPEEEGDFDADLPAEPVAVEGDLYEFISVQKKLRHVLYCGSATESDSWAKILGDEKLSLLCTDPPYNVDYQGGTHDKMKIMNDKMSDSNFYSFLYDFFVNAFAFSKPGAPAYVFYSDSESINFRKAMLAAKYKISSTLVWVKNNFVLGRLDYHMQHEPLIAGNALEDDDGDDDHQCIVYGWNSKGAHPWYSDRKQSSILNFDKPKRNADHPTMKPVEMISYLIKNSSRQGEIVADGFNGSGTTLIACEMNWRQCRATELDPRFVDVNVRRWVAYMVHNNLEYEVWRNGRKLTEDEIKLFNKDE